MVASFTPELKRILHAAGCVRIKGREGGERWREFERLTVAIALPRHAVALAARG